MDEEQLKHSLGGVGVPPADEEAIERALTRSMAEFDQAQRDKSKKNKGFSFFARLLSGFNTLNWRRTMNKRLAIGGVGAAFAALLAVGIGLYQYRTPDDGLRVPGGLVVAGRHERDSVTAEPARGIASRSSPASEVSESGPALPARRRQQSNNEASRLATSSEAHTQEPGRPEPAASIARADAAPSQASHTEGSLGAVGTGHSGYTVESGPLGALGAVGGHFEEFDRREYDLYPSHAEDPYMPAPHPMPAPHHGRDQFETIADNPVKMVSQHPVSTFSVDVDTSSYSYMRRQLLQGVLPQKAAVRIEELINYFTYQYPLPPDQAQPFQPTVSVFPSPWNSANRLLHIGIKGYDIPATAAPAANLVFLLDVSGSMNSPDKLPLVKSSLRLLLGKLKPDDSIAIVVYADAAGTVLEPTPVREKAKILNALDNLQAGGSTAGAAGIRQAYRLAESRFDENAVNRVILATDGDFNVGIVDSEELKGFIERQRKTGIFLSVLGFGAGNLNDWLMQELAQNGNGVAAYIDTLHEARKVLVEEASASLFPIARDVKIQVEFNPAVVTEYRLIGYETRALRREDFSNDAVDAGDVGSGHSVTALYEITLAGSDAGLYDALRYQHPAEDSPPDAQDAGRSDEYAFVKIRYKRPGEEVSQLLTTPVTGDNDIDVSGKSQSSSTASEAGWATAVAGFGQLLRGGRHTGTFDYDAVIQLAERHKGTDKFGYRAEFIQLARLAKSAE